MSFFGVRVKNRSQAITVNLHGNLEGFPASPTEIRSTITSYLNKLELKGFPYNLVSDTEIIAEVMADKYCNEIVLWIEVIAQSAEDTFYSAVRERLHTNV